MRDLLPLHGSRTAASTARATRSDCKDRHHVFGHDHTYDPDIVHAWRHRNRALAPALRPEWKMPAFRCQY
jgi:hypothetical protein